ncbi:MAG: DUF4294 domain-containing protein [Chitinophagales bacterium]
MGIFPKKYIRCALVFWLSVFYMLSAQAQQSSSSPRYGHNDTLIVPMIVYQGDTIPSRTLAMVWVTRPMSRSMRKRMEEWTRLRNAVYVTYPYARKAGVILNEMNLKLAVMSTESQKSAYIKTREKELKKEFTDPLERLSVYQGKVLMKLINRQTGNNCYNIIKEYKGGFTARFWQTVAFFFGSSLKQPYDAKGDDQVMESIVLEVERMYHS